MRNVRRLVLLLVLLLAIAAQNQSPSAQLLGSISLPLLGSPQLGLKLDPILQQRTLQLTGQSRVVIRASDTASLDSLIALILQIGGRIGQRLPIIHGQAATVPNTSLAILANSLLVRRVSLDRRIVGSLERTGVTIGATAARQEYGYDGAGIGVGIIDSGVTPWHDDLTEAFAGIQRVDRFVDLINSRSAPYDDYGHGTHVAGIVAGNGFDSQGARTGIAPAARLIAVKALNASGGGRISDVIAALDYLVTNKDILNIRIINLSVAAAVYESYDSDPLTLAAKRAVQMGIVVVAAAGNNGRSPSGRTQYGGVTAPGNAPWVLTVGASSHMGTHSRADDTIAAFSSRGPGAVTPTAKPDVVAPGVGIESLSDPNSAFYTTKAPYLLDGTVSTPFLPYLSLSGTSMATPVVTGTIALMLQANPALTPNQVKAIVQYTAETYPGYDALTQGAGFLNAKGAIELARFLADSSSAQYPSSSSWGAHLLWGNHMVRGGVLTADANAWATNVTWGTATTPNGQPIAWGVTCTTGNCVAGAGTWERWGAVCADATCSSNGYPNSRNVVWGSRCGGADCNVSWSSDSSPSGAIVVWGTDDDGDIVVWGTGCNDPSCSPVIWDNQ